MEVCKSDMISCALALRPIEWQLEPSEAAFKFDSDVWPLRTMSHDREGNLKPGHWKLSDHILSESPHCLMR